MAYRLGKIGPMRRRQRHGVRHPVRDCGNAGRDPDELGLIDGAPAAVACRGVPTTAVGPARGRSVCGAVAAVAGTEDSVLGHAGALARPARQGEQHEEVRVACAHDSFPPVEASCMLYDSS